MRVAPIGLIQDWSAQEAFEAAASAAAITHSHPSGYWSAAAMAAMTRLMVYGMELSGAATSALELLDPCRGSDETINSINSALKAARSEHEDHPTAVRELGEGWVGEEALAIALYAALVGQSFPEVFAIAANHDGDSDSTASIAG